MAINKGNIKTSVNYNLEAQKPLDARAERPTKADLHKRESWSSDGDTIYIHEGQITYTEQEKKLFLLKDVKNFESEEAWAQILTTDDEIQGGGSDITVDSAMSESSTNPVQNRVVKKYVDDAVKNIPSGEGGGSIKEVYIGPEKPEDESVEIWIDTDEEYPEGGGTGGGNAPSGGGYILVYWYKLTDEQKAHNATAYQQILNEFKAGRFPQVIVANTEIAAIDSMGIIGVYGGHPATYIIIIDPDSQAAEMLGEIGMSIRFSDTGGEKILNITPDGAEHNYND